LTTWKLTVEREEDGKVKRSEKAWEGDGVVGMGGVLGKHTGIAESLRGVRYALVLVLLASIDQLERK
jgi:hypothetical protein